MTHNELHAHAYVSMATRNCIICCDRATTWFGHVHGHDCCENPLRLLAGFCNTHAQSVRFSPEQPWHAPVCESRAAQVACFGTYHEDYGLCDYGIHGIADPLADNAAVPQQQQEERKHRNIRIVPDDA